MRKIVVMRPHEWLVASAQVGDFAVAAPELENVGPAGVDFVAAAPVPVAGDFVLVADVADEAEEELLARDDVAGVFEDLEIAPFPAVCPDGAIGTIDDVAAALGVAELRGHGHTGLGVRIAIVDTGVDGKQVRVSGGWSPWPEVAPGTATGGHGTMCAADAQIAAPDAQIHDYPLLRASSSGGWVAFLSDGIRFFAEILGVMLRMPGPMVVSNSWGLYDRSGDAPVGHPQNYSANPAHPFNTITSALVASGADVVFAAGNCGTTCPAGRCGAGDIGPGNSIHGANSHPEVITVGAVTVERQLLGYSSQGPGGLAAEKPDLCGYANFAAPAFNPSLHDGTSASAPVVAGVVAALRSNPAAVSLPPAELKAHLIAAAAPLDAAGWNPDSGHGIVDAAAVWNRL